MIIWFTGKSGAGKTTAAKQLIAEMRNVVHLDGDDLREVWTDLGFSDNDRYEQNMRIAKLARLLDRQGFNVVISTICPEIKDLREKAWQICRCKFIHL